MMPGRHATYLTYTRQPATGATPPPPQPRAGRRSATYPVPKGAEWRSLRPSAIVGLPFSLEYRHAPHTPLDKEKFGGWLLVCAWPGTPSSVAVGNVVRYEDQLTHTAARPYFGQGSTATPDVHFMPLLTGLLSPVTSLPRAVSCGWRGVRHCSLHIRKWNQTLSGRAAEKQM
jgi:hypothetical protein